jgi:hypothetical protein
MRKGSASVHAGLALEYHSCAWGDPPAPLRGWRTEDWEYVETVGGAMGDSHELYDLRSDPLERHNRIGDAAAAGSLHHMRDALHGWLRETGDAWPQVAQPPQLVPRRAPLYERWPVDPATLPGLTLGGS